MSWYDRVIWSEGLFLQPQHFQQQDRYVETLLETRASFQHAYGWGFRGFELNGAALALGNVELASARGVMPDGTPFNFPQKDPPPLPLAIDGGAKNELIVLALPVRRPGTAEVTDGGNGESSLARFSIDDMELTDTHAAQGGTVPLRVGRLRLRLMRASDMTDAYCTLGVVGVTERRPDNQLLLDNGYIPPMLSAGENTVLRGYISELLGLLNHRGAALASHISQPGRGGVAEIADFLLLQTVNRYEPLFRHLATHTLLHPERLFTILLQLAGDLDTFQPARRALTPPQYVHDDLEASFRPVIADLRLSLSMVIEQSAIFIELRDVKYGVRVGIVPDPGLYKSATFVLAVNAQVPPDTIRTRFPSQVKIGPAERIRDLVNVQLPGIPLRPLPVAPRQIKYHAGFTYFELEQGGDLWTQLERSGGIALHVAGEFPNLELELWAIRG